MTSMKLPWEIKRELLTKAEEEPDMRYGYEPKKRPIEDYIHHGIVSLDKTAGPSSHEVTAWVRKMLGVKNAGHGGTLETFPMKSGKSQSDWYSNYRSREREKSLTSAIGKPERVCLCYAAPSNQAERQNRSHAKRISGSNIPETAITSFG